MRALTDIIVSLYNFRNIGRVLSKRPVGLVIGSFLLIAVLYALAFSMWYSSIAGDFINAALNASKPDLPTFSIISGQLTINSTQPYIKTHEDIYKILLKAIVEVDKKRFGGKHVKEIEAGFETQKNASANQQSFCFVMDTTDAYKQLINLSNYTNYVVINKDSIEYVDRVKNMPGNITPLSQALKQNIDFKPDLISRLSPPIRRVIAIMIAVGLFIFTPIHFLFKALIAAFLVWLGVLIARKKISFGAVYKISIYSLVPVVILAMISQFRFPIHGLILQVAYFACIIIAIMAVPKAEQSPTQKTE